MAYKAKTHQTDVDVDGFLAAVEPEGRRADGQAMCALMAQISGEPPRMWGPTIVGFGSYHFRYDSGHEGDSLKMGFSPRKAAIVLYLPSSPDREALLSRLGKYTTGKSCLYIKRLDDTDPEAMRALIAASWRGKSFGEQPA